MNVPEEDRLLDLTLGLTLTETIVVIFGAGSGLGSGAGGEKQPFRADTSHGSSPRMSGMDSIDGDMEEI